MTLKYCLNLTLTALLLFEINISNVMANDCDNLNNVMKYMGDNMKQDYSKHTNCCQFKGIICDNQQRITEIQFKNLKDYSIDINSAIGEMGNLQSLTSLEITNVVTATDDSLTSKIGDLKNLKTLIIKDNYIDFLGTPLPQEIGNLKNLERLELSNNSFNGKIPKSIGNLENLKVLNLQENTFEGTIPYEFKNLKNLEEFNVNGNTKLNGYVPLLPKVATCDYGITDLCSLKSSKCKSSLSDCTKEEVQKTNKVNGNPNPSDESQYEPKRLIDSNNKYKTIGIIVAAIVLAIIMCIIISKCCKCCRKSSEYSVDEEEDDDDENGNKNKNNNGNGGEGTVQTTNINVNINANLGTVQTVDITDTSMINGPANGFVDITTPYDNALTPYNSSAASPTPASPTPVSPPPNDYKSSNNPSQQENNKQNYIPPPNPSTYKNNSMFAGPANGFVDITTPYDSVLTPYESSTSNSPSPSPISPNNNYYPTSNSPSLNNNNNNLNINNNNNNYYYPAPNSPSLNNNNNNNNYYPTPNSPPLNNNYYGPSPQTQNNNYNPNLVPPVGFVPQPVIAYPPPSNYTNK
jgi:hypothetical protein